MINTVAVIEEGIGAVSLGFAAAGFQVTDVFIKDKKAVDILCNNIETRIHESSLMELSPKEIADVDIIAIVLLCICIEILKYTLGDYLTLWYEQENTANGMYRFDLCCKIKDGTNQDFFNTIQQYFNTKYIVFEFKNCSEKITQKEIYTTEKYLYEKALRRVAIIISRKGADENALDAVRGSLRETGKLILCLSDKDILELIDIKQRNEQPTGAFLEAMLDELLIHLEK